MAEPGSDRRIDYIEMAVSDIERARAFYGGTFGWTFTEYGPDYCEFFDGRLKGGFARGSPRPGGGPLIILYALDLELHLAPRGGCGRHDREGDLPVSGRAALPLRGSRRLRARCLVGPLSRSDRFRSAGSQLYLTAPSITGSSARSTMMQYQSTWLLPTAALVRRR